MRPGWIIDERGSGELKVEELRRQRKEIKEVDGRSYNYIRRCLHFVGTSWAWQKGLRSQSSIVCPCE